MKQHSLSLRGHIMFALLSFQSSSQDRSAGSQTSLISTDALIKLDDELSSSMPRSQSSQSLNPSVASVSAAAAVSVDGDRHSLQGSETVTLTELQQKALTGTCTIILLFLFRSLTNG